MAFTGLPGPTAFHLSGSSCFSVTEEGSGSGAGTLADRPRRHLSPTPSGVSGRPFASCARPCCVSEPVTPCVVLSPQVYRWSLHARAPANVARCDQWPVVRCRTNPCSLQRCPVRLREPHGR